jgi:hypothetical protein
MIDYCLAQLNFVSGRANMGGLFQLNLNNWIVKQKSTTSFAMHPEKEN